MCNFSIFCSGPCFVYFYSLQLTCIGYSTGSENGRRRTKTRTQHPSPGLRRGRDARSSHPPPQARGRMLCPCFCSSSSVFRSSGVVEYPILAAGRRWRYGQARRHSNLNEGEPVASRRIDLKIRCNTSVIGCIRCVLGVIGCVSCVLGVIGVYYLYSLVIGVVFGNSCNSFWR